MNLVNPQNIVFVIGVIGTLFTIYNYFRNPQITLEKGESLLALKMETLQKDVTNLRDNHIHTLDTKIEQCNSNINLLTIQVTKLSTIMDERFPKK